MTTKTLIGQVAVDSGQIMIIDPCYIGGNFNTDFDPPEGGEFNDTPTQDEYEMNYNGCCHATLSKKGYGSIENLAIACSTLYGDGVYPVYAEFDNRDRVKTLTIDFNPEPDNACDYCGEDLDYDCRCNHDEV